MSTGTTIIKIVAPPAKPVGLPLVTNGPDNPNDNANNNPNLWRGRFRGQQPV